MILVCHPITGPQPTSKLESQFPLKKRTSKNLYPNYSESKNSMHKKCVQCLIVITQTEGSRTVCSYIHESLLTFSTVRGAASLCVDTVANFQQITVLLKAYFVKRTILQ